MVQSQSLDSIGWVIDTVIRWDRAELEWVDAFQAADVVPVLMWIGATLVMRVDAADRTEEVLRGLRVELVHLQRLGALNGAHT